MSDDCCAQRARARGEAAPAGEAHDDRVTFRGRARDPLLEPSERDVALPLSDGNIR